MDWRAVTFDWNRARAFLVTAEEGSLSAAARALKISQPTLGRQVAALEEELGVALFQRIGGRLTLTEGGLGLMEHMRAMGDAAMGVALAASGRATSVEGHVAISATEMAAVFALPPIIARMRRDFPGITLEIVASDANSDLRRREADIAIRGARPTADDLIARRLLGGTAYLYAARSYLAEAGPFETAEALAQADFVGTARNDMLIAWLGAQGATVTPAQFGVTASSHMPQWELVKAGLGICAMVSAIGELEPMVARTATWLPAFRYETWLVAHRELTTSPRIRLVYDRLAEELVALQAQANQ